MDQLTPQAGDEGAQRGPHDGAEESKPLGELLPPRLGGAQVQEEAAPEAEGGPRLWEEQVEEALGRPPGGGGRPMVRLLMRTWDRRVTARAPARGHRAARKDRSCRGLVSAHTSCSKGVLSQKTCHRSSWGPRRVGRTARRWAPRGRGGGRPSSAAEHGAEPGAQEGRVPQGPADSQVAVRGHDRPQQGLGGAQDEGELRLGEASGSGDGPLSRDQGDAHLRGDGGGEAHLQPPEVGRKESIREARRRSARVKVTTSRLPRRGSR